MKEYQEIFSNVLSSARLTVESKFNDISSVINMDINADTALEDVLKQRSVVKNAKSLNNSVTISFDIN